MQSEPYAQEKLLFYPGSHLSAEEKRRMDEYQIPLAEVTYDHLVYSMGRQIENNFQSFYTVAEDIVGEEAAKRIAYEIGRRYGGLGYRRLLAHLGMSDGGSPRTMALYQDLVHSIRGPKHTSALFAEYDDERCIVRRRQCTYFSEEHPENGKYTGEFERGACDGYAQEDPNLSHTEVRACRWKGNDHCEMHWVFRSQGSPVDG